MKAASRLRQWAWWLLPFGVVLALYGRMLSFPLYWDDARHDGFTRAASLVQIWLNATGYGYYRPAIFTFYKFAFANLAPQLTFLCYGVALVLHALNSVLAGQLTAAFLRRGGPAHPSAVPPPWAGTTASLLFAAYPFSLFAVGNFAALMHPVVTFWTLAGALAMLRFVQSPQRRWLGVMVLASALAPWFHESGVAVAAILAAGLVTLNWRLAWRHKWGVAALALAAGLFGVAWLLVPKTRGATQLMDLKMMAESLAFFVQALTFPLQPLATLLRHQLGWWEIPSVWAIAIPSLLALALLLWRLRQWRAFVFGLVWFGLASAPSIAFLPYWYIVPSPRLLYEVAPAAVLIWTLGLAGIAGYVRSHWASRAVISSFALAALAVPGFFIAEQLALFQVALNPLKQLAALARTYRAETHLVVNPPDWVATVNDVYPLGRWGVEVAPGYVLLRELVSLNAGLPAKFDGVHFPPVRTTMPGHNWAVYHENDVLDWGGLAAAAPKYDRVWLTTYARDQIAVEEAGSVKPGEAARPDAYLAGFEGKVFLVAAAYRVENAAAEVTLMWRYLGPDPDATIFRHIFDCAGNVLGLGDGHVLDRMLPFGLLVPGAEVRDVRRIPLEPASNDGCYTLEIGLFRPDGSRVPAASSGGAEFADGVVPVH